MIAATYTQGGGFAVEDLPVPEIADDETAMERFRNELKAARRISHRNVCRMYDMGEEKGTHFITMEYVPGEDLKNMLRMMGQMSPGKTIGIARQVCEGLAEAHPPMLPRSWKSLTLRNISFRGQRFDIRLARDSSGAVRLTRTLH